ncbi:MAG: hypothetical protein AVDCRST_MAG30-4380 [uncultured Solirubrobacteraceae bacterium]|uniref:Glycosyltransferase 2-like domain-containing protein n=1 Tax=uncultured Solirubrobacteraceae bacterium TaxID=1162706 RepID=A0A6J4U1F1_9ACTN|nr:MAG: hypothetical protein AVDCRST_MAG30-4380 [uncultured Solirubrobacteraceae bacterium]
MTAAIAVVVPARDAEATLGRTLEALAAQIDAPPHEVVVVDNGSLDGTGAVARAGTLAQSEARAFHHLAEMVADGQVLVERHHDARVGQGSADVQQRFDAEVGVMVQVHHVRPQLVEQLRQLPGQFRVGVGVDPVVEARSGVDELVRAEGLLQPRAEPLREAASAGSQEPRRHVRLALQRVVELVGGDFGPAARRLRVHVREHEDAERRPPRLAAPARGARDERRRGRRSGKRGVAAYAVARAAHAAATSRGGRRPSR